ncbi:MAG: DUF559 domain-containing protein [Myxococcales bacterium]
MRASQTSSEQLLWQRIRGRRLGVVFRRQVPCSGASSWTSWLPRSAS